MLLVKWSYETGHCRHLSNHIFGVRNFGNTKPMRVIFFFKTFKISDGLQNGPKIEKKLFFSAIIASALLSLNSSYEDQDTFHRQQMC